MKSSISITRRLTVAVLLLEAFSALALIGSITLHERQIQLGAFDATLLGTADSLMGAVQDTEDESDDVMLDLREVELGRNAVFRVEDERGRVLGSSGELPASLPEFASGRPSFHNLPVGRREYRVVVLHGLRVVDPGKPDGGVRHHVTIVYGLPAGHIWHEVLEAIRFFAIATAVLLGITAAGMVWLLRRSLSPLHALAQEAERITSKDWRFEAPESARSTVELRPLAEALEAALARLQRSFEQQRRLNSDSAHELKTDVAIVKSSLQLLSMRKRTAEEYGRGLDQCLDDFTRLEATVQTMLTLARLEQPIRPSGNTGRGDTCSLREALDEALHQSKNFAELKAVQMNLEATVDALVPIDRHDALLLCSNILLNALQHSPDQSTIHIAMAIDEGGIILTVRDQGEGIADKDAPHLFEPFYRGDPSRSRKSGGTGLGLSICKAICERAGGSIRIANTATGGALVTINLPGKAVTIDRELSASIKAH